MPTPPAADHDDDRDRADGHTPPTGSAQALATGGLLPNPPLPPPKPPRPKPRAAREAAGRRGHLPLCGEEIVIDPGVDRAVGGLAADRRCAHVRSRVAADVVLDVVEKVVAAVCLHRDRVPEPKRRRDDERRTRDRRDRAECAAEASPAEAAAAQAAAEAARRWAIRSASGLGEPLPLPNGRPLGGVPLPAAEAATEAGRRLRASGSAGHRHAGRGDRVVVAVLPELLPASRPPVTATQSPFASEDSETADDLREPGRRAHATVAVPLVDVTDGAGGGDRHDLAGHRAEVARRTPDGRIQFGAGEPEPQPHSRSTGTAAARGHHERAQREPAAGSTRRRDPIRPSGRRDWSADNGLSSVGGVVVMVGGHVTHFAARRWARAGRLAWPGRPRSRSRWPRPRRSRRRGGRERSRSGRR